MNGWIRLTRVNGKKININPIQIIWFAESSEDMTAVYGCKPVEGATSLVIAGTLIQVQESEREIMEMAARLLDKVSKRQSDNMLALKKRLEKEDWEE